LPIRRVARRIGKDLVRGRKQQLRDAFEHTSTRRLKAVRAYVNKGGSLAVADHFPGAEAQETGGVISSPRPMPVWFTGAPRRADFARRVRGRTMLFANVDAGDRRRKWVRVFQRASGRPLRSIDAVPVAVLMRRVRSPRVGGFFDLMESAEREYRDRLIDDILDVVGQ